MAERRFVKSADYQSSIRTNGGTVLAATVTTPGSTAAQLATATGLNSTIVNQVLADGLKAGVLVARSDFSGVVKYWRADTWASRIITYLSNARTWGDGLGSNGALEGTLASALVTAGLASQESEAVATALVNALINEGNGETAS
jgi:hypothetical protein